MDEGAPAQAVTGRLPAQATGQHNGLAQHVAAVEAARHQLGRDLDRLAVEARAQMGQNVEKITWKLAAAGAGIVAGLAVRSLLTAGWKAARRTDPPTNPAAPGTGWGEALAWTVATAAGMGAARLVAVRGAAAGWQKATGQLPPGLGETPVGVRATRR